MRLGLITKVSWTLQRFLVTLSVSFPVCLLLVLSPKCFRYYFRVNCLIYNLFSDSLLLSSGNVATELSNTLVSTILS